MFNQKDLESEIYDEIKIKLVILYGDRQAVKGFDSDEQKNGKSLIIA